MIERLEEFNKKLNTKILGKKIKYYQEIDSTQLEVWRLANESQNGLLIMADMQTNGKGTHGRTWYTSNNNIAFSFLIVPNCTVDKLDGITIDIAKIIVQIFEETFNIKIEIKAPNDLMAKHKKLGGILTETKVFENKVKYLNIGIGINNNQISFPNEIQDIATSIKKEFNTSIDRLKFIAEFCNRFENYLVDNEILYKERN